MASEEHNHEVFVFEPTFLLRTPRRHKPSSESDIINVSQAQHNSLQPSNGPAQSSEVKSKSSVAKSYARVFYAHFFLFFFFFVYMVRVKRTTIDWDIFPSTADT